MVNVHTIQHVVVKAEVVGAITGLLAWKYVQNEYHLVRILPAPEGIDIGVIRRRVERDQRCFPMAGGPNNGCAGHNDQHYQKRYHASKPLIFSSPLDTTANCHDLLLSNR